MLEEGTYYIGDPKWAFTDDNGFDWKEVKDILELSEDDEMRIKGEHVSCFYTVLGKGWFQDNAGVPFRRHAAQGGGGGSEKSDSVGGFGKPPPFFKNAPWGGFRGIFRRRHTVSAKKILVVFFWTAHPKFCP